MDVSRCLTMPLAAGKNIFLVDLTWSDIIAREPDLRDLVPKSPIARAENGSGVLDLPSIQRGTIDREDRTFESSLERQRKLE